MQTKREQEWERQSVSLYPDYLRDILPSGQTVCACLCLCVCMCLTVQYPLSFMAHHTLPRTHTHTHTLTYIHTAGTQCVVRDSKGKMTVRRQWRSSWETRLILLPLFPSVSLSPSLISLWLHVALSVPQQSFHTLFDCRQHHVSH